VIDSANKAICSEDVAVLLLLECLKMKRIQGDRTIEVGWKKLVSFSITE
jgi:hypothetical protein